MTLLCRMRQRGDVAILDLEGILSLEDPTAPQDAINIGLGEKVRELVESGQRKILLNFAGVRYMDSAGVGQLIGTYTSARNRGAALKLMKPTRDVRKVLELTQLARILDVRDDEEKALAAFAA
jgi:anti-sigma B factor antagonist